MSTLHATAGLALVPSGGDLAAYTIRTADELAVAFIGSYSSAATREAYRRDLQHFGRWLGRFGLDPLAATRLHIDAYARESEQLYSPATVARRLATLSKFYERALDEELISRSPMTRVRRPRVSDESPRVAPDRDGVRALLDTAARSSDRDHALVVLLVVTGVRISEALGADIGDLGEERGHKTLTVRRKGGRVERVALPPRAVEAIERLIGDRGSGPIFATRSGRRLDRHAALKTVRRLARVAGIERPVFPHALRHAWVTLALDAGVPIHVVADGAGHRSVNTTRRYDRQRNALDKSANYTVAAHVAA